ncbi:hypothetical protein SLS57_011223 [Botryosphaeria dothidea]
MANPKFRQAVTTEACESLNPIWSLAYADKLYNGVTYPNIVRNAHASSSNTFSRLSKATSKPLMTAWTSLFRLRTNATAIKLTAPLTMPTMRSAQGTSTCSIVACAANENTIPPIPDPDETMPLARLRFFSNHCDGTTTAGSRLEKDAGKHGYVDAETARYDGDWGGQGEGTAELEASDEGVVEGGGAGEG